MLPQPTAPQITAVESAATTVTGPSLPVIFFIDCFHPFGGRRVSAFCQEGRCAPPPGLPGQLQAQRRRGQQKAKWWADPRLTESDVLRRLVTREFPAFGNSDSAICTSRMLSGQTILGGRMLLRL